MNVGRMMTQSANVSLVVDKINTVMAQGDQCMGLLFNKTVPEWKEIFNAVTQVVSIPIVTVEPLQSDSRRGIRNYLTALTGAFQQARNAPVIILADTSGNNKVKNANLSHR